MPKYPHFDPQPNSGTPIPASKIGPPDLWPTSLTSPRYYDRIEARAGRTLAGDTVEEHAHPDNAYAVNELAFMRELDDVQGDGIFDPPGTHPNIYPDAGVFAARYSLPGYHVREVPFKYSEVRDATTGRQIIPVPSGAVALDTPAKLAQLERNLYEPAQPVVWSNRGGHVRDESIVNWAQNPEPVHGWGIGEEAATAPPVSASPNQKTLMAVVGLGLAFGALYALMKK